MFPNGFCLGSNLLYLCLNLNYLCLSLVYLCLNLVYHNLNFVYLCLPTFVTKINSDRKKKYFRIISEKMISEYGSLIIVSENRSLLKFCMRFDFLLREGVKEAEASHVPPALPRPSATPRHRGPSRP